VKCCIYIKENEKLSKSCPEVFWEERMQEKYWKILIRLLKHQNPNYSGVNNMLIFYRNVVKESNNKMVEGNYRYELKLQIESEKSYERMYWKNYENILKKNFAMYMDMRKSLSTLVDVSIMDIYERIYDNVTYNFYQKQFRKEKLEKMFTQSIKEYCRKKEMERTIIKDNKIIFSKSVWIKKKEEKIRLYLYGKNISLNYRNWNKMIIENGMNLDVESIKIVLNRVVRKSYLNVIDEYRCNEYYFDLAKEFKFDHRINDILEMIKYVETKQEKRQRTISNVHYLSLKENERIDPPKRKCWFSINNSECIKIKPNQLFE
jgi:hypothetical protein